LASLAHTLRASHSNAPRWVTQTGPNYQLRCTWETSLEMHQEDFETARYLYTL